VKSNNIILGLLAIIAGVMVLFWHDALELVVGIFLIVWGILVLIGKK
jgi:hypothetical protein